MSVYHFGVGVAAAVRDPGAIAGVEHWLKRSNQAAGRNDHVNRLAVSLMHIGLPIRNNEEVATVKTGAELYGRDDPQSTWIPLPRAVGPHFRPRCAHG